MTRGKILFVDLDGRVYCSTEFNGDMYPDGSGDEIIERFEDGHFQNFQCFQRFVERFNRRNFGYEEDLIYLLIQETPVIDICTNWTDYLYIINTCGKPKVVIADMHNNQTELPPNAMAIVRFGEIERIMLTRLNGEGL